MTSRPEDDSDDDTGQHRLQTETEELAWLARMLARDDWAEVEQRVARFQANEARRAAWRARRAAERAAARAAVREKLTLLDEDGNVLPPPAPDDEE
jgi:hypothetical protein